jgi:capsular polysaccharide biosynthesis protein
VKPTFPKTFLFVLGAFFLAFPLGIGTILVVNFFDHSFNHPKEVEDATGCPVLAVLNKLSNPRAEGVDVG